MSKIAGKRTKRYPRFRSEIGDISLNLFPQVAGGFALLPYAATLCGTQRTENLRLEIAFRLLPLYKLSFASRLPGSVDYPLGGRGDTIRTP